MLLFLLGFMGSGKTTIGKKLANTLHYAFIDLDAAFEQRHSISISDYFQRYGEAQFRNEEQQLLHTTLHLQDTIISLGGGTPCHFDNLQQIKQAGFTIYLKLSPTSLVQRLANSPTPRPLVAGKSLPELQAYVETTLQQREPYYQQADLIVKGELGRKQIIQTIINHLAHA